MKRAETTMALLALAFGLGGCASITRGTSEQVQFNSDPPGAEMRTSTGLVCTTPCALPIPRKDEFVATFTKAGYRTETIPVGTAMQGGGAVAIAGNVIIGGVIGGVVDASSGATLDHVPNPVNVSLQRLEPAYVPPAPRGRRARGRPSA